MALPTGHRLGPYEIQMPLGAGGMGEVYRARDTRLDRVVAIKIVPEHLANLPDLRERFDREARTISSLSHPHICALYDVGSQDGVDFLVMEFLEGETLAARLEQSKALPLDEVLQIGVEIADALDKAHRQGVVHRDLKPGNIMLTPAGAKLLDFGLAKQAQPAVSMTNSIMATNAAPVTAHGTILGTLQYMAPEQLEGREADARTDIFAFGALLYEMATGRRAFEAKSQVSLMAAIVDHDPPPLSSLLPVSPALLDHLVKCCLAKNPDKRWQSMADVLLQLQLIADGGASVGTPASRRGDQSPLAWGAAALFAAIAVGAIAWALRPPPAAPPPLRVDFEIETPLARSNNQFALSPTGEHLVTTTSVDSGALWVRAMDATTGAPLRGTDSASWPFWSPDGRHVGFFADGKLKRVDLRGGVAQNVADAQNGIGGAWNRDNVIVYAPGLNTPLSRVSAAGGVGTQVTTLDASRLETGHRHPWFLPDGRHFLYVAISSNPELSAVFVGSLDSPDRTMLVPSRLRAAFAPPHSLLFMRDSVLMVQKFDPDRLTLSGEPTSIAENVGSFFQNSAAGFSPSDNGLLAIRSMTDASRVNHLRWFDRQGKWVEAAEPADYDNPSLSPDGQRVAVSRVNRATATVESDVWTIDLTRGTSTRLTFEEGPDAAPVWTPDGTRIVFSSNRAGKFGELYTKLASGVTAEELLLSSPSPKAAVGFSPDGQFLLYRENNPKTLADLWALPMTGDKKAFPVVQSPFNDQTGQFSPDGRWIAYESNESGRQEIYLIPFPVATTRLQVSTNGGNRPRWRRDGKELFYFTPGQPESALWTVDVDLGASGGPRVGLPKRLFAADARGLWDVAPDGQRFLLNTSSEVEPALNRPIRVMVNWQR